MHNVTQPLKVLKKSLWNIEEYGRNASHVNTSETLKSCWSSWMLSMFYVQKFLSIFEC